MSPNPMDDVIARLDAATTADAEVVRKLRDQIGTGMTQQQVDDAKVRLGTVADHLEAIGKDPSNPVPPPPTGGPGEPPNPNPPANPATAPRRR